MCTISFSCVFKVETLKRERRKSVEKYILLLLLVYLFSLPHEDQVVKVNDFRVISPSRESLPLS